MRIRCDYCNNYIKDTDEKCPYCGSVNAHLLRGGEGIPKTIEELKAFCEEKKLPLEKMRFFVGKDCKEARAFGIYKDDNDNFVVYKNKSDGSRMVRYQGKDEAFAVNEIYQKLRSEVIDRKESGTITPAKKSSPKRPKSNNIQRTYTSSVNRSSGSTHGTGPSASYRNKKKWENVGIAVFWIVVVILAITLVKGCADLFDRTPNAGYYQYNGEDYYNDYSKWYSYDDDESIWVQVTCPEYLVENYKDYYIAPPVDTSKEIPEDVKGTFPTYDRRNTNTYTGGSTYSSDNSGTRNSWYDNDDDSSWGSGWYDNDDYGWGSSWDDDWDSGWDDDDWDYDYSGWNDYGTDWDSDW